MRHGSSRGEERLPEDGDSRREKVCVSKLDKVRGKDESTV